MLNFMISNKRLQRLSNCIMETKGVSDEMRHKALATMKKALENWSQDSQICKEIEPLFQPVTAHIPEAMADLFLDWMKQGKVPSLLSVLGKVTTIMEIDENYPLLDMAACAAILGDTQGDTLPFHNKTHVLQVTLVASVLGFHHNRLNPYEPLEVSDFLSLFTAACIHDLGHDGQGNYMADGRHLPSRLEIQSVEMAEPFLRRTCEDEDVINRIGLMVVTTDVSESDGNPSPASMLKFIMRARMGGASMPPVPMHLNALSHDARLGLLALFLEEADLIPSMALSYELSRNRTVAIAKETEKLSPDARTLHGFINKICDGMVMSDVGSTLFGDSFDVIKNRAEKEQEKDVSFAA